MAALSVLSYSVSAQSSILTQGEIAPCGYAGNQKYQIINPIQQVIVLFKQETMVYAPVAGKVVAALNISNDYYIIINTPDGYFVTIGNLKQTNIKKGDDIQKNTPLGLSLPDLVAGNWSIHISYDTPGETLPCNQVLEKMKLW